MEAPTVGTDFPSRYRATRPVVGPILSVQTPAPPPAMEPSTHTVADLFAQLGLPAAPAEIDAFISAHRPGSLGCALHESPAWTPTQAAFLREAIEADADWALPAEWLFQALCHKGA